MPQFDIALIYLYLWLMYARSKSRQYTYASQVTPLKGDLMKTKNIYTYNSYGDSQPCKAESMYNK